MTTDQDPDHPHSPECGFDRNGSIAEGCYVCMCGWRSPESSGGEASVEVVKSCAGSDEPSRSAGPELSDIEHPMQHAKPDASFGAIRNEIATPECNEMLRELRERSDAQPTPIAHSLSGSYCMCEACETARKTRADTQPTPRTQTEIIATNIRNDLLNGRLTFPEAAQKYYERACQLERENADLRHDIERYVKTNLELATDLHEMMLGEGEEGAARIAAEQRLAAVEAALRAVNNCDEWNYLDDVTQEAVASALAAANGGKA